MTLSMTSEKVIEFAVQALKKAQDDPARYQSWYVQVNGHRVAPKWLVSQLTGLPVSNFHSDEARRVLQQLGVEVCWSEV